MSKISLDEQILSTYEEVLRKEKIDIHLAGLEDLIFTRQEKLKELESILSKQSNDIQKLEKVSILSLFRKILGNPEKAIDREKQDYLLAVMKYNECKASIEALKNEQTLLRNVQSGLFGLEKRLENLIKQKDSRINLDNPGVAKQIAQLDQRMLSHKEKLKELDEAIQAGERINIALRDIIKDLRDAVGWGPLNYGGKGKYSTYKKKRFIDKASSEIVQVNALFLKFEEELHDVSKHYHLDYKNDIHYYQDFLDTFINNLITDYVVRKKIKNSLAGVEATLDRVEMTILTLQHETKQCSQYMMDDKELKRKLLLDSVTNPENKDV